MKDNSLTRVFAVLVSPTVTFRSIVDRPTWLLPIVVLTLLGAVSVLIAAPKIDWQETIETKLERSNREVPAATLEPIIGLMQDYGTGIMLVATVVAPWTVYPLMALILMGLLRRAGGELSFRTSLGVLLHSLMPWAVVSLISIPLLLPSESLNLYDPGITNLTAFANDETSLELFILLQNVDLFSLWALVLLVIGYSIAAKIPKGRTAACVVGLWAVWVAFLVGMAALE